MRLFSKVAIFLVVMASLGASALAQGPLQKRMDFTINVPYHLRMQNYMLPAGTYILHQISQSESSIYALYQGDMRHSPIAAVQTVRINYTTMRYPDRAAMHWHIDESTLNADPVITGWDIPGDDGWEIIAVVPNKNGRNVLTRVR